MFPLYSPSNSVHFYTALFPSKSTMLFIHPSPIHIHSLRWKPFLPIWPIHSSALMAVWGLGEIFILQLGNCGENHGIFYWLYNSYFSPCTISIMLFNYPSLRWIKLCLICAIFECLKFVRTPGLTNPDCCALYLWKLSARHLWRPWQLTTAIAINWSTFGLRTFAASSSFISQAKALFPG
jgi:hypothetical protein